MFLSVRTGSGAVIAILAAALLTPATPAFAASAPAARPATTGPARSHPAGGSRRKTTPAPGFGLTKRPAAWDGGGAPAGRGTAVRARRGDADRAAHARTRVPDTCSGSISPDVVYPCTTPSVSGTDTFALTLTSTTDLLVIRVLDSAGDALRFTVTAPDSSTVSCQQPNFNQVPQCPTSQSGVYTLQVENGGGSYTLAFMALLS